MLNKIANTPYVAEEVIELQLCSAGPVAGDLWSMQEWQLEASYRPCECIKWLVPPKPLLEGIGSTMAKAYGEYKTSHGEGYSRYQSWWNSQRAMVEALADGTAPRLNLHRFPNLKIVATVDCRAACNSVFATDEDSHECSHSFQELMTSLIPRNTLQNTHLSLFMLAVDQADFALSMLILTHFSELLADRANQNVHLHSLRHLVISEPSEGKALHLENGHWTGRLASWVNTLCNLEKLEICRRQCRVDNVDIFAMLQTVRWPKLRRVRLCGVATTAANLRYFLLEMYPHKVLPLEELKIITPIIVPNEWAALKEEILRLDPLPKQLFLGDSYKPCFGKRRRGRKAQRWYELYSAARRDWPSIL